MADRKQGAGLSSGSSAAVHKAHLLEKGIFIMIKRLIHVLCLHLIFRNIKIHNYWF